MAWNPSDQQLDDIKKAWTVDGNSASQIASHFDQTRNVIIGIIHRRGWVQAGGSRSTRPRTPAAPRAPRLPAPTIAAKKIALVLDPTKFVAFDQLGPHHCRYPVDGGGMAGKYCGLVPNESPYCDGHAAIVYQPQQPRKIKRPR